MVHSVPGNPPESPVHAGLGPGARGPGPGLAAGFQVGLLAWPTLQRRQRVAEALEAPAVWTRGSAQPVSPPF